MHKPRSEEDSRLCCHFGSRRRHRTSALNCNNVLVWKTGHERRVIVCLGASYAHQIIGPDDKEMMSHFLTLFKCSLHFTTNLTRSGTDPTQKAERGPTKRPNSQPKPNQNKNHVHSGQLSLTEGWTLIFDKGGGFLFHTTFWEEPNGDPHIKKL